MIMKKSLLATLAGLLGYSIYGFSFLFSKIALEYSTPVLLLAVRFITAFLILNALLLCGNFKLSFKGKPIGILFLLGLAQPVMYFIFETYGIELTTSSISGVIIGLSPVVGMILSMVFLKEKSSIFHICCAVASVAGVALTTGGGFGSVSPVGVALLLGAVFSGSAFAILSRHVADKFTAFERTYIMIAMGSAVFSLLALAECRGEYAQIVNSFSNTGFWISVLYLAGASSVAAFMLINYALSYISVAKTMIFSNFTTVISILAGIFILGDSFEIPQLVGIAVIVVSVCLITCTGGKHRT